MLVNLIYLILNLLFLIFRLTLRILRLLLLRAFIFFKRALRLYILPWSYRVRPLIPLRQLLRWLKGELAHKPTKQWVFIKRDFWLRRLLLENFGNVFFFFLKGFLLFVLHISFSVARVWHIFDYWLSRVWFLYFGAATCRHLVPVVHVLTRSGLVEIPKISETVVFNLLFVIFCLLKCTEISESIILFLFLVLQLRRGVVHRERGLNNLFLSNLLWLLKRIKVTEPIIWSILEWFLNLWVILLEDPKINFRNWSIVVRSFWVLAEHLIREPSF